MFLSHRANDHRCPDAFDESVNIYNSFLNISRSCRFGEDPFKYYLKLTFYEKIVVSESSYKKRDDGSVNIRLKKKAVPTKWPILLKDKEKPFSMKLWEARHL